MPEPRPMPAVRVPAPGASEQVPLDAQIARQKVRLNHAQSFADMDQAGPPLDPHDPESIRLGKEAEDRLKVLLILRRLRELT